MSRGAACCGCWMTLRISASSFSLLCERPTPFQVPWEVQRKSFVAVFVQRILPCASHSQSCSSPRLASPAECLLNPLPAARAAAQDYVLGIRCLFQARVSVMQFSCSARCKKAPKAALPASPWPQLAACCTPEDVLRMQVSANTTQRSFSAPFCPG